MDASSTVQKIKPRSARSARALKAREPQINENTKMTLFLQYTSCSKIVQLLMRDLLTLKTPLAIRFHKKNDILPMEDPSSLEFFSEKNDASLFVFGRDSKKRPHALTFIRMFQHKVLDMLELMIEPSTMRTLSQFKTTRKAAMGMKPLICFSGTPFESPVQNEYTLAKSMFLDLFKGADLEQIDVEGLQYILCFSAADEIDGEPKPRIHLRSYLIRTKKSGQRLPRVEVEEMGPRADFIVARTKVADEDMLKQAMKKPKGVEPKNKKNVTTDLIGDKIGRIHIGKQDLKNLQTRKMKGLKRNRDADGLQLHTESGTAGDEAGIAVTPEVKRLKV